MIMMVYIGTMMTGLGQVDGLYFERTGFNVAKKGKGSESGLELRVYRGEEGVGRDETPWFLIEGSRTSRDGKIEGNEGAAS